MDIMEHGCIMGLRNWCMTKKLYSGPYDASDGMVPLSSSKLPLTDSIQIPALDHGEAVLSLPFTDYDRKKTAKVFIKMLLEKGQRMLAFE